MCGIAGSFNYKNIKKINKRLNHRGPDATKIHEFYNLYLSHNLLSIVDYVEQPIFDDKHILVANCEIYNWQELAKKHKIKAKNDAELLFELLKKNKEIKKLKNILKEINGVYAFGFFWYDNGLKGILTRDIFGIRPLWYYFKKTFYFASERKALPSKIKEKATDLNPRIIAYFDFKKKKEKNYYKGFYDNLKVKNIKYDYALKKTETLLKDAIKHRINTDKKVGVLVSGGVDSSLLLSLANKNKEVIGYNVSIGNAKDYQFAKKLNMKIKFIRVNEKDIEKAIPKVCKIIESADPVKVSVALPFYFVAKQAKKDNVKILLLGNGADDIFCGYARYDKNYSLIKDTISRLRKLYDTDNYRDDTIFMHFGIEARFPYLDKKLVDFVLPLPEHYKIDKVRKKILRDIAIKYLPKEIAFREKKAAQYGSNIDQQLKKIAKKNNLTKGKYLKQFFAENSDKLGCLFTGGKDSVLALHIMHNMNYTIKNLITIEAKNKDSYMFHTPNINLTSYQAKALGLPLILEETTGEKEKELKALRKALKKAKKQHINGIISGALYSTYQRDRIEKIADRLGLKVFSPLWHKDQYFEVLELINLGIKAIIIKIAAYGLTPDYLGKIIDKDVLIHLKKLNEKIGFNIAGEGGEYETFVIDAPLFKKPLKIKKAEKVKLDQYTSELIIKEII